jgi:hypothetical protein
MILNNKVNYLVEKKKKKLYIRRRFQELKKRGERTNETLEEEESTLLS